MSDKPPVNGFLRHIRACNRHDLSGFRPFSINGVTVGQVRIGFMERLLSRGMPFVPDAGGISLHPSLTDGEARTQAVAAALDRLVAERQLPPLRREMYDISTRWGQPALLRMDRAAVPFFGVTAHGVHVNGFVRKPDGLYVWVGLRARDRGVAPGKYDNLVAGGQPAGLSLMENLVKEAWEEAGLPAKLAQRAQSVGSISYQMEQEKGLKSDVLFLYDLELPAHFTPRNHDGEVEDFELWPIDRVAESVSSSDDWKFNVNLTVIDFLIRHGWLTPDHADYLEICQGLRR